MLYIIGPQKIEFTNLDFSITCQSTFKLKVTYLYKSHYCIYNMVDAHYITLSCFYGRHFPQVSVGGLTICLPGN